MWCRGRSLPMMIGHFVPHNDPHWLHFLRLQEIMELVFAPTVHPDTPPGCHCRKLGDIQGSVPNKYIEAKDALPHSHTWKGNSVHRCIVRPCSYMCTQYSYTYNIHIVPNLTIAGPTTSLSCILHTIFCRVGPPIHHWTMQYEAKHQYFNLNNWLPQWEITSTSVTLLQ